MKEQVRVAAVSVDNKPGDANGNRRRIDEWCKIAAEAGAELVLFPELSLTGFVPNHPTGDHQRWLLEALSIVRTIAEPIPGPGIDALTESARRYKVLICAGLLEDAGNLLFNTQALVGPDGLIGAWRKMHVPMFEMPFYNGGEAAGVVQTALGRIGVNVCFDAFLPESTRLLAVRNVELALFPFAADPSPGTAMAWATWARPVLQARCAENGIFGIGCNYVGKVECAGAIQQFPGGALAFGPRGELIAEWCDGNGSPGMLLVDFRSEELRRARAEPEYAFRFRRPEIYGALAR